MTDAKQGIGVSIRALLGKPNKEAKESKDDDLPKYDKLVATLRSNSNTNSEKINAVNQICFWIKRYSLRNASEPWLAGKHLANKDQIGDLRLAGYQLLIACIESRSDLPIVVRLMFFNDLEYQQSTEDIDLQMDALIALSKYGRDISGFESYVCRVLASWMDKALANLDMRKGAVRRGKPLDLATRHEDLRKLLNLLTNIVKCHFAILQEGEVAKIVNKVTTVCKRTGDEKDLRESLYFFDATVRYGYIPIDCLPGVINVICSVYIALPSLREPAMGIMQKMLRSHMSQATIQILRRSVDGRYNVHDDVVQGAIRLLTSLLTLEDGGSTSNLSFNLMFDTLKMALDLGAVRTDRDVIRLDLEVLHSVYALLTDVKIVPRMTFDDWKVPFDILTKAIRSLDPVLIPFRSGEIENAPSDKKEAVHAIYHQISGFLERLHISKTFNGPEARLMEFWASLHDILPESTCIALLDFYSTELWCYPSTADWLKNIAHVGRLFFVSSKPSEEVRSRFLKLINEVLFLMTSMGSDDGLHTVVLDLLEGIPENPDSSANVEALNILVHIGKEGTEKNAKRAVLILKACTKSLDVSKASEGRSPLRTFASPRRSSIDSAISAKTNITKPPVGTKTHHNSFQVTSHIVIPSPLSTPLSSAAARGLVELFVAAFTKTPSWHGLFLFSALLDILTPYHYLQDAQLQVVRLFSRFRADCEYSLYLDPEAQADLRGAPQQEQSMHYVAQNDHQEIESGYNCMPAEGDDAPRINRLPIDYWLQAIGQIIRAGQDWDVYIAVQEAILQQLTNMHLFGDSRLELLSLRATICEQLISNKLPFTPLPPDIKREDVMQVLVNILASLVGFHNLFTKLQEDEIVAALQSGLLKWQKASTACIHALTICAYEIPLSTSRILSSILVRLSQLVTSTNASVHILEFLSSLASLPNLYSNFREEDYRRVFGVALQHIQYASALSRDASATQSPDPLSQAMPVYVLTVAYDVVYSWFLALKLPQRPKYVRWILEGLQAANPSSGSLDERSQVCYDFLVRFCNSNADIKSMTTVSETFSPDASSIRSWIYGNSIVSYRTMVVSGLTEFTVRRPSGSISFLCKPNSDLQALSVLSIGEAKDMVHLDRITGPTETNLLSALSGGDAVHYTPSYMLLQMTIAPELADNTKPILLTDDDATRRAIGTFDRIPVVDFHKIGILYVGQGQRAEREILANTYGSPEYVDFLVGIGDLARLKGNTSIYTGGLDANTDEDGEFAYFWKDKITQVIFHTCTLMPTRPDVDPNCNRKKSHIGNDFVTLIWNGSNQPYDPRTIGSEFNFINIVISPDAYLSRRNRRKLGSRMSYKVKVLPHEGLPAVSPASEWRLISAEMLPAFVRTIAMHCNSYAQVHHANGNYVSMWRQRLQRIQVLRSRLLSKAADSREGKEVKEGRDGVEGRGEGGKIDDGGLDFTTYI